MDVFEAIRRRKAVRTYTDRPIPDEVVDRVLRALNDAAGAARTAGTADGVPARADGRPAGA